MIRTAVVGYGNIGRYAIEAIEEAQDMELAGLITRNPQNVQNPNNFKVATDVDELGKVDVAVLCIPTRAISEIAPIYLSKNINTIDSYDIHGGIWDLKVALDEVARKYNSVSIISSGWDPGSDSVIRMLMQAIAPKGLTYTNFGPGMSMGHTVVAKSKKGVKNALSITIPSGAGIHKRAVYIELCDGADFMEIKKEILADPYFAHDFTTVTQVEDVEALIDMGHGVYMERKGVSGRAQNQRFSFEMTINNPAATAQIMVSCARASVKQKPGAYTLPEIPVIDLLYGSKEQLIKSLV